jgi:hypothetical protein
MAKTVAAVYPENMHVFALARASFPPEVSRNVILVGIHGARRATAEDWDAWADAYEPRAAAELDMTPAVIRMMVEDLLVTLPELGDAPVFTDDYAPIETMSF